MADSISPLNRTLEILRRQIAEHARHLDSGTRAGTQAPDSAPASRGAGRADVAVLRQRLTERLRAIDPADPNAARKKRRVFLESVLAWEFGEDLLRDPGFQDLIERLEENIALHPALEQRFSQVLGPGSGA